MSRLKQNTTTLMGTSTKSDRMDASNSSMHVTKATAAASKLSSVARSAKYVCSRFIA